MSLHGLLRMTVHQWQYVLYKKDRTIGQQSKITHRKQLGAKLQNEVLGDDSLIYWIFKKHALTL